MQQADKEDLTQEKEDNKQEPDKKKAALNAIIDDYNRQYGTNHNLNEFDLYYQDVQQRIKDPKIQQCRLPAQKQNRHHHRGGHASHRF